MKKEGFITAEIDKDGKVRLQISDNDSPDHGTLLTPFETVLSDGQKSLVHAHRHDHGVHDHGVHGHTHVGGSH